jgi:hypothetical protein
LIHQGRYQADRRFQQKFSLKAKRQIQPSLL